MNKKLKPLTKTRLENIALHYVSRYASSSGMLERVLRRRILKAQRAENDFPVKDAEDWLTIILERFRKQGYVDDKRFAGNVIAASKAKGLSRRGILQKLQQKGLSRTFIREEMAETLSAPVDEDDLKAALIFARRKSLGAWRKKKGKLDKTEQNKELTKLCRAGFSLDIARKALRAEKED
jgi:regulatory protein